MKQCARIGLTGAKLLVEASIEVVPSAKTETTFRAMKIDFKREFRKDRAGQSVYPTERLKPDAQTDQARDGRRKGSVIWLSRSVIKSSVMALAVVPLLLMWLLTIGFNNVKGECLSGRVAFLVATRLSCTVLSSLAKIICKYAVLFSSCWIG